MGDGTIANISALLIARNATFNYLLGWGEATQSLGPEIAWKIIKDVYGYKRMVVITSKGAHYSVSKAAHIAGVGRLDVIDIAGSVNPWILDGEGFEKGLEKLGGIKADKNEKKTTLLLAVVLIAGKTETGYIDEIDNIAKVLDKPDYRHPDLEKVLSRRRDPDDKTSISDLTSDDPVEQKNSPSREPKFIETEIKRYLDKRSDEGSLRKKLLIDSYLSSQNNPKYSEKEIKKRWHMQVENARYNRPFIHVDAAHGGAFLTVPSLRNNEFKGIHLVDTVTLDGHKMFYCYYPCGGLLIRTSRWARSLHTGESRYISEDTSHEAYGEDRHYLNELKEPRDREEVELDEQAQKDSPEKKVIERFQKRKGTSEVPYIYPGLYMGRKEMAGMDATRRHNHRPAMAARSELRHQPFTSSLEGSRGCQGIMQMYFNLSTIGFDGYRSLLEWTYLLTRRCAEAVSLGRVYVRPVTKDELPTKGWMGNGKDWAIQADGGPPAKESGDVLEPRRVVPVLGGRLLCLSNGSCNQLLVTYIPRDIAMRIASQGPTYWNHERDHPEDSAKPGRTNFWQTMHYLWRVNEHLWVKYLYANPAFTYYVGHTEFEPLLPNKNEPDDEPEAKRSLEKLLCNWNIWARWSPQQSEKDTWLFEVKDLKDSEGLALKLSSKNRLSEFLRGKLSESTKSAITAFDGSQPVSKSALVVAFNKLLDDSNLYDEKDFDRVNLSEQTLNLIKQKPRGAANVRLNRLLLEDAFPQQIAKRESEEKNWVCPFFQVLTEKVKAAKDLYSGKTDSNTDYSEGLVRFFAHKIVIMHPYTDESILSDLLGKMMFWGERSAEAVQAADASCQDWLEREKR